MNGKNPNCGESSPTSNILDLTRGKLRYKEKAIIMLSALALANGEIEKLYRHFSECEEIEFLVNNENFVGRQFLAKCFPKGTPPGFHGPVIGAIAVRGNDLETLLGAIAKPGYIMPLYGDDVAGAAHAIFAGLKEFLA